MTTYELQKMKEAVTWCKQKGLVTQRQPGPARKVARALDSKETYESLGNELGYSGVYVWKVGRGILQNPRVKGRLEELAAIGKLPRTRNRRRAEPRLIADPKLEEKMLDAVFTPLE